MAATDQFRDAIRAAGIEPPAHIEADGKLHRFASNGKTGDDAGWYVLRDDGIPAGVFGDWRTGASETWRADIGRALSPQEEAAHRARIDQIRQAREAEAQRRQEEARKRALEIWSSSPRAPDDYPYLKRKGVSSRGLRIHDDRLVVPMSDGEGICNLQLIDHGGEKRFLSSGKVRGAFCLAGKATDEICICEGIATAWSVRECTGRTVVVAFHAGNILPVARLMRDRHPDARIIVCADDDAWTEGNPGMAKAREAARAVDGVVAIPDFGSNRPEGATDFNDLARHAGPDAVRACIDRALATDGDVPPSSPEKAADERDAAPDKGSTEESSPFPPAHERPCFAVLDDWTQLEGRKCRPGVYLCDMTKPKGEDAATPIETWLCSPLHVEAVTFDGQENNFGRLLRFKTSLGKWREWAMPMELLRGAGDELRGELLAMGVELDPVKARQLLPTYLQREHPKRRMRCALQTGWAGGSFVLPDQVIGPDAGSVIFQSGERGHDEHTVTGTLQGWQEGVAARAIDNPLLLLALSAGFAGPILARCNAEGGGLHFVGDSSTGKTSALEAACSIWGGPSYRRSWRATANGMEGAAVLFNDCLLALDEISECDPRDVGAIVYALGNGRGKQRASRSGAARGVARWRCLLLSTGERSIGTAMAEGGYRTKAGQSVRLLDVPVAREHGLFDSLHGADGGAAFADSIKRAAATHYGHAGRAFLERLTRDTRDFGPLLEQFKSLPQFQPEGDGGQERRVAARFALVGLAGELATEYGLAGWREGAAIGAAAEGFRLWREARGAGNDERRQIGECVSTFLERHGDSRFSRADSENDSHAPIRDRAGWWRDVDGKLGVEREYLFTASGLREALKGFDFNRALDVLEQLGALQKAQADGKRSRLQRIYGRITRVYAINPESLAGGDRVD